MAERTSRRRKPRASAPPALRTLSGPSLADFRVMSDLLQRFKFSSRAGLTHEGRRDTYQVLGYATEVTLQMMRDRYERGGLAARVVEAFPKATWRGGGEIIEDDDPDVTTKFEKVVEDLSKRLSLWSVFLRADILSGLGQYSGILIGAPGELDTELKKVTADKIAYLAPYSQQELSIKTWDEDVQSPRFGLPVLYTLQRRSTPTNTGARVEFQRVVHWTRIVHVAEAMLDDPVYAQPRLLRVWNLLDDLDKITGAGAEAFWLRAHQGFVAEIDKDMEMDEAELKAVREHMEEFAHQIRRTIGARGVNVRAMGSDTANIGPNADAVITQIAGATEIPQRILTGSEMGELASTQDTANWNVRVLDRRKEFADPHVVRAFVDRLISLGAFPEADYEVVWPQMESMNEIEKANVASAWAAINAQYGGVVITDAEIRQVIGKEPLDAPPPPLPAAAQPQPNPMPGEPPAAPPADAGKGDGQQKQPQQNPQPEPKTAARRSAAGSPSIALHVESMDPAAVARTVEATLVDALRKRKNGGTGSGSNGHRPERPIP